MARSRASAFDQSSAILDSNSEEAWGEVVYYVVFKPYQWVPLSSVWVPFGFPRKKWVPFINMHNGRVNDALGSDRIYHVFSDLSALAMRERIRYLFEFSAPLVTHRALLSTLDLHTDKLERKSPWDSSTIEIRTIEVRSAN